MHQAQAADVCEGEAMTAPHAFPANHFDLAEGEHGMTLRDYFAAACIAQLVTSPLRKEGTMEGDVRYAYKIADAMLEARK